MNNQLSLYVALLRGINVSGQKKIKMADLIQYFEELKYEEISEILETSVGGLKASYHLAVKKIEAFLKED